MAEYVIVIVLIALTVIVAIRYFGSSVKGQIEGAKERIDLVREKSFGERTADKHHAGEPHGAAHVAEEPPSSAEPPLESPDSRSRVRVEAGEAALDERDEYSREISRLHRGVGDADHEKRVVEEIRVNYLLLILLGFGIIGGAVLVLLLPRLRRKKTKKKRKFTLGEKEEPQE